MKLNAVLYAPKDYWSMDKNDKERICSRCDILYRMNLMSNSIWFLDISEACNIWAYMYYFATSLIKSKEEADRVFLNNMLRLIEAKTEWGWLRRLRLRRAYKYYLYVKHFEGPTFWVGRNDINTMHFVGSYTEVILKEK